MLTKVDIERIMAAKQQLTESILDEADCEQIDDFEIWETRDEDAPVTETNGLM